MKSLPLVEGNYKLLLGLNNKLEIYTSYLLFPKTKDILSFPHGCNGE